MQATGYPVKNFSMPTKRYCQTLDLKNDAALIAEYEKRHEEIWPEIREGLHSIGVLEMEIYRLDTRLFMIVETPADFEWEEAFTRLASLPRQQEWEDYMSIFQDTRPGVSSQEKWKMMDRMFKLD